MELDHILRGMGQAQARRDQEYLKDLWKDLLSHDQVSSVEIDWVRRHISDIDIRDHAAALLDGQACLVSGRNIVPVDVIGEVLVAVPLAATA